MRVFCSVVVWHFGSVGAAFVSRVALVQGPLYTSHNTQLHRAAQPQGTASATGQRYKMYYGSSTTLQCHITHNTLPTRETRRLPYPVRRPYDGLQF